MNLIYRLAALLVALGVITSCSRRGPPKFELDPKGAQFADLAIQRKNQEIVCTIRPHGDALVGKFIDFVCYDSAGKPIWRDGFLITPSAEHMQKSDRPNEYTHRVVAEWDSVKAADVRSIKAIIH